MNAKLKLTAGFEPAEEGGYVAFIEEIQGVNTQGDTLEEARENLLDSLELKLDALRALAERKAKETSTIVEDIELS